jgi:hypothetical protein
MTDRKRSPDVTPASETITQPFGHEASDPRGVAEQDGRCPVVLDCRKLSVGGTVRVLCFSVAVHRPSGLQADLWRAQRRFMMIGIDSHNGSRTAAAIAAPARRAREAIAVAGLSLLAFSPSR